MHRLIGGLMLGGSGEMGSDYDLVQTLQPILEKRVLPRYGLRTRLSQPRATTALAQNKELGPVKKTVEHDVMKKV